jgi:hypothetical protein
LKEGYSWSEESGKKFIELQNSINPGIVFDTKEIQKQTTQEEVDYFLKNSMWPWSKEVEDLYKELSDKNTYIRLNSEDAINNAKTKYNQSIITEILSSQLDDLQKNQNVYKENNNERDGLGSYPFASGLM